MKSILDVQVKFVNIWKNKIESKCGVWIQLLRHMFDVTLFLGARGLAFRGDSQRIGDANNSNFLGILELQSHYDPLLETHLNRISESQQQGHRSQVHYMSSYTHNEFIAVCAKHNFR